MLSHVKSLKFLLKQNKNSPHTKMKKKPATRAKALIKAKKKTTPKHRELTKEIKDPKPITVIVILATKTKVQYKFLYESFPEK